MLLDARDVTFAYSKRGTVLHGVSLSVSQGEVVGLIGPNGSGKSTLIKAMVNLLHLKGGSVSIAGHPNGSRMARESIMYLASNDYLPEFLTGREYLEFMHGLYSEKLDFYLMEEYFGRYQLEGRSGDLLEDYSHGMRKKTQLIASLMLRRPLTIIDETLNGIDIDAALAFEDDLKLLGDEGRGLLLCSHDFRLLEKVADRIIFLHRGVVVEDSPLPQLLHRYGSLDPLVRHYVANFGEVT